MILKQLLSIQIEPEKIFLNQEDCSDEKFRFNDNNIEERHKINEIKMCLTDYSLINKKRLIDLNRFLYFFDINFEVIVKKKKKNKL